MADQTGPRKYWRESDARAFVQEYAASGLTIEAFAETRGISAQRLQRWHKRFGLRAELAVCHGRKETASAAPAQVRIARVERVAPSQAVTPGAVLTIEVGSARALVPAGFDAQTVRAVVEALLDAHGGAR